MTKGYASHAPVGNPCLYCGLPPTSHRVKHHPDGDPCRICGLRLRHHRAYTHPSEKLDERRRYRVKAKHEGRWRDLHKRIRYLGIDGEGQGREVHRYVMMGCADEAGAHSWVLHDPNGISTHAALQYLLGLPRNFTKLFSFSFNYDLTKILKDVDNETLYHLFRPELRMRPPEEAMKGPYPVYWLPMGLPISETYSLNLQGSKFTVKQGTKKQVVWDIFKFYQSRFTAAIKDWKVGTDDVHPIPEGHFGPYELEHDHMSRMKDRRADFDKADVKEVERYCLKECSYMAQLAHKLVDAHTAVGLDLRNFHGAGSSASAILNLMGIREQIRPAPEAMADAVACAFFGGRFENSVIGAIEEGVWNYDISSAYPYQTTFLPCLVHGVWRHTRKREDLPSAISPRTNRFSSALVRYALGKNPGITEWGPFPFRTTDGSICFPIQSGGGWVYLQEYLAGESLFPHVEFREAWVYETACDCQPFKRIPEFYTYRCKIGKEGPGIAVKLAVNAVYGKLAQSLGNPLFNSWLWAGMITSGTRAQILHALGIHKHWRNLLMVATDGIYSRERLPLPKPLDTGTFEPYLNPEKQKWESKPLGGWEEKEVKKGVFVARPGIYFPLNPTKEEIKDVRGRGVGKGVVLENSARIVEAWTKHGVRDVAEITNVTRFCGAKTSISRSGGVDGKWSYTRAYSDPGDGSSKRLPEYGEWVTRPVALSFSPKPKREGVCADGLTLALRNLPRGQRSTPYSNALRSDDTCELRRARLEALEQPDADLSDYEEEVA